ncbi:hypothetical protein KC363_g2913 [Hortaea werneckii]|uniref:Uncharacterized protein n=1 Tax=Hortaea werneckii TaxID=91943 RepID=A0A3M7F5K9_HORWE|nr:hypothetical protein KC361_g5477 [Hortaea werneckii]KAI7193124.1 hypothetical protein KC363_g2913 [Hortaea werneckii]KAI7511856.1 hypothetical protein KC347_g3008 [Hortaea werneckii]RMY84060.1 hypothetical protein D0861_07134 [Hortaea werneckii]
MDTARDFKRRSKGLLNSPAFELCSKPASTTLYITYTAEMRMDQDTYMLGIDKCFKNLEQANDRVEVLGETNSNVRAVETKLTQKDEETGCLTVTWGRYDGHRRFVAQAMRFEMLGKILKDEVGCSSPGGWDKENNLSLFHAETQLDIPGHVWVIAVHDPKSPHLGVTDSKSVGVSRRHSLTSPGRGHGRGSSISSGSNRSPSAASKLLMSPMSSSTTSSSAAASPSPTQDPPPRGVGWTIESVWMNSEKALQHGKKAWNQHFRTQGRCRKIREHYGFARYALKPTRINKRDLVEYETCLQIRIERVRVVSEAEPATEFIGPVDGFLAGVAARNAQKAAAVGKSIVPPLTNSLARGKAYQGDLVSTRTGQRSSFVTSLQAIADAALKDGIDYDELPLALKIRQEHMARWGSLMDDQRYIPRSESQQDGIADLYHALLQDSAAGRQKFRHNKAKAKVPSEAGIRAKKRMMAALGSDAEGREYKVQSVATSGAMKASTHREKTSIETQSNTTTDTMSILQSPAYSSFKSGSSFAEPQMRAKQRMEEATKAAAAVFRRDEERLGVRVPLTRVEPRARIMPPGFADLTPDCFANAPWLQAPKKQVPPGHVNETDLHEKCDSLGNDQDVRASPSEPGVRYTSVRPAASDDSIATVRCVKAAEIETAHAKDQTDREMMDDECKDLIPDGITLRKKHASASHKAALRGSQHSPASLKAHHTAV